MTTQNEVEVFEPVAMSTIEAAIENFRNNRSNVISSFKGEDFETKIAQTAAMQGASKIADNLNKEIQLAHFIIQPTEMPEVTTGELKPTVRVILVDKDNKAFYGFGMPLFNALQDIVANFGMPESWGGKTIPVKVTKGRSGKGFEFFNLQVVSK